jgi:hypothetical protein
MRKDKKTEKEYRRLNKVYQLSRSGKLMIERIRKTKLKIGLVASLVFLITFVTFFTLIFPENSVTNTKRLESLSFSSNSTATYLETTLSTTITDSITTNSTETSFYTKIYSPTTNELSETSLVLLVPQETKTNLSKLSNENDKDNNSELEQNKGQSSEDKQSSFNIGQTNLKGTQESNIIQAEEESTKESQGADIKTAITSFPSKYHYVIAYNISVFDSPENGKAIDTLKYATYVEKLDEVTYNNVNFSKVRYNTPSGVREGWIRSSFLSDTLKSITGEEYNELVFEPFKKIKARVADVRGIYLTRTSFSNVQKINHWVEFAKSTNINAFVVDVKDDDGFMLFETSAAAETVPEANAKAFYKKEEMKKIIKELKDQGLYLIARIVCFKDPSYARAHKDRAIVYKDTGEPYMGIYKVPWASAYDRQLWEYNVRVAIEAVEVGFDEIQYDYVRFPELSKETRQRVNLRQVGDESFAEAIQKFLIYSKRKLEPYNVPLAADVFGLVSTAVDDVGIGQYWEAISNVVDYICPMVYPSHYAPGSFGLSVPDAYPYETIYSALKDGIRRNLHIPTPAKIRPWLQSFTATWVRGHIVYDEEAIRKQIKAAKDLGINEYMLWNASNNYKRTWYK